MGSWNTDPFGNDTACDWKYQLVETDDMSLIGNTLQRIHDTGSDYLEAPDAEEAIAAADTLARLKGRFYVRNSYTESLDQWIEMHPSDPPANLIESAVKAIDRILAEPSEILELWQESGEFKDWKKHIENLKDRLK